MRIKLITVTAIAASSMLLSGCATTEAVKRAQATADQALLVFRKLPKHEVVKHPTAPGRNVRLTVSID